MTKIASDDILYKLRIRESEKFKIVSELYNKEILPKKAGRDYHRLKTMVKKVSSRIYRENGSSGCTMNLSFFCSFVLVDIANELGIALRLRAFSSLFR